MKLQSLTAVALTAMFSTAVWAQPGTGGPDNGPPGNGPAGNRAAIGELGKLLFFDKLLSGNQNISCATCHHPFAALGDGLSLPVGAGGTGLGVTRETAGRPGQAIVERVPRNAPHIFAIGDDEFTDMFF